MLIRALVVASSAEYAELLAKAFEAIPGVEARGLAADSTLWGELSARATDLIALDAKSIVGSTAAFIGDLRSTPEAPEVIAFVTGGEEPLRAELQAAQAFAVIDIDGDHPSIVDALAGVTGRLAEQRQQSLLADRLEGDVAGLSAFASASPSMQEFLTFVRRVVDTNSTLLVLGETGVGKEYLSRAIHEESARRSGPFVPVNCGALSASLLESELFGHVEGAFTGAHRARKGYFELAHNGTLFLDEVGELEPSVQVKLLRVLQDKRVQPVGGETEVEVDVRLIAATNRDLVREVEEGRFRSDLFYRLSVVRLEVPPLRRRREDIEALFESNVEHFRTEMGRPIEGVRRDAMELLEGYQWPGNVRELANVAERAVILARGRLIALEDLPLEVQTGSVLTAGRAEPAPSVDPATRPGDSHLPSSSGSPLSTAIHSDRPFKEAREEVIDGFERAYFESLLHECRGHINDAAKRSGLHARSLYEKLKRLGLRKEDFKL